jgi:hypothetical protein
MKRIKTHVLLLSACLLVTNQLVAQDHLNAARGDNAQAYDLGQVDAINVYNGNLSLSIPLGQKYPVGGGLDYSLTLRYNAQLWDKRFGLFRISCG